jgi:hypothetical protein
MRTNPASEYVVINGRVSMLNNPSLTDKVTWFFKHLEADGLEILSKEDFEDLKMLKATRDKASTSFTDYL